MDGNEVTRRSVLQGGAALAGLAVLGFPGPAQAFARQPGEEVVPWLDQPPPIPAPAQGIVWELLQWEALSWLTPNDRFFTVAHFGVPAVPQQGWRLEIGGLVGRPMALSMADLRARPRQEVAFTLECSGNHGLPFLTGAIGNAVWAGTPLAPLLQEAGVLESGTEVVFWGSDAGEGQVGEAKVTEQFARSMSLAEAMDPNILLCYEMNGQPLHPDHGFPLRLIAPGWYGVANVKWLERIELLPTRYVGRFMSREYVTMREEQRDGRTVARFTLVGHDLIKSAPGKVIRADGEYRIVGAAWGSRIARVEVSIDGGPWLPATLEEGAGGTFAWTLWSLPWGRPAAGEHTITSRAIDVAGWVQPAPDDPSIATKRTFWESNQQITRRVLVT